MSNSIPNTSGVQCEVTNQGNNDYYLLYKDGTQCHTAIDLSCSCDTCTKGDGMNPPKWGGGGAAICKACAG